MPKTVKIDLSSLPEAVQQAVGPDLAMAVAKNMRLTRTPLIVGRLGPGIYGFVQPDAALNKQIQGFIRR